MSIERKITAFMLTLTSCASSPPAHQHEHEHGHDHKHGQGFHHRFDDAEKWAKVFDAPERDAWQRPNEVVALLAITPGMTVADLGAGTGYFLPYLSRATGTEGRVLALDTEPDMVAYMKTRAERQQLANVEARQVAPADPQLEASSIDRLLIVDTWHHIDDRPHYTEKLARALKPGGAIFVVDFTLESAQGPPKQHRLSAEAVAAELREGGLEAEILSENLPDQYVVRGARSR